jgi:hypothetical protein
MQTHEGKSDSVGCVTSRDDLSKRLTLCTGCFNRMGKGNSCQREGDQRRDGEHDDLESVEWKSERGKRPIYAFRDFSPYI